MIKLLVSNSYISFNFFTRTHAHLDLQLEPSSSDLTTQPLLNNSPVFFSETLDQVNAHPSEPVEQTEHTTTKKVHTPPDTTLEVPPLPKKNAMKL